MPNMKDIKITPDILKKISEIDLFKGSWISGGIKLEPDQLNTMKRVATIESVGSSNRIEGNNMSDAQIEKLFSHIDRKSFRTRDEQEVAGYADLVNTIFDNYQHIELSENYIFQLHQILLRYSDKDERHRGEYKHDTNRVAAFDKQGKEIGTIFETASPFDTPRLMKELIEWTNTNFSDKYFHPIIVIGVFIVHFLSIHPFTDGNGRLSRALTILLMLKSGYTYMPYTSMESIIESSKDSYYLALRRTQKTIWKDSVDYEPWLSFFITSLHKQKCLLEEKIAGFSNITINQHLSGIAKDILNLFKSQTEWTVAQISEKLKLNPETVKKTVQTLVGNGFLIKKGVTNGVYYILGK